MTGGYNLIATETEGKLWADVFPEEKKTISTVTFSFLVSK